MYPSSPHQQLLQAIVNVQEQQIPIILQFISSLDSPISNTAPKTQAVLEKMGGYPKFLLEGAGNLSDRDVRKKAIADKIKAKHQARHHE